MSISFLVGTQRIRFAGKTDVGQVRAHNEDAISLPSEMALAVLADGMGGHAAGEVASELAVETIEGYFRDSSEALPPSWPIRFANTEHERDRVTTAIKLANARIWAAAQADSGKRGMGCTVDLIHFAYGRVYVGHVGDSRVYRLRAGRLDQVTEDHSLLNDYRRMKDMTAAEIDNFRHKNVVVRALGLSENVSVDVYVEESVVGDIYLLCSDGLNDMISDEEMGEIILHHERKLDTAAAKLVDAANEAGGKDNISVILVSIESA
jgi:protein phosphatase